ncbi:MAG TPA: hypothetical protein VGB17_13010 [Pyrinomonadaceae bacterium]|jgi:hypothetical protein
MSKITERATESGALARLQRLKSAYQSFIKLNYEQAAEDCRTCPTRGLCCTDAHFVNVHITRLEACAIRETLSRSPRLTEEARRAVYQRARQAVKLYGLRATGETFKQTFACPLYEPQSGCLVHRRAKPAPCIQHACYQNWEDLPPTRLQTRAEHRIEQLNTEVYGAAWAWLPLPVWLCLVDPEGSGAQLEKLAAEWSTQSVRQRGNFFYRERQASRKVIHKRMSLPVIN